MADGDRLLRVMLEEELGFSLEVYDHPLKQALGFARLAGKGQPPWQEAGRGEWPV